MSFMKIGACIFAIMTFTTSAFAQQLLTLEECRKLALENNKSLKIATAQEQVAYYQKKEAFMQYFPKISASGTYMHFSDDIQLLGKGQLGSSFTMPSSINGIPIPAPIAGSAVGLPQSVQDALYDATKVDISDVWLAGISATQPIFTGGRIIALNDIRSYAQKLAKSQKETQTTNVIVEVDEAYWQVVSLANKEKLAQSYVDLLAKMDSDITEMESEGVATKADRLSVRVKLNEAEMSLTRATNGVSLSKMLLCQICGIEISDRVNVADENIENVAVDETAEQEIPNIEEAIANRSEIQSLDLVTKIYKKKEKVAFADFLPTAGASLGYNWTNPNMHDGLKYNFAGMWNVAVKVTVPLNFMSSSAKVNVARAESRIQQFELEDAKEKVELQVNQSNYKLIEAGKKLISAKRNIEKANENLRYANVGFEEGVIPSSDALSAHSAWIQAHSELIDAQIDLKLCRIYLDKALGKKIQ